MPSAKTLIAALRKCERELSGHDSSTKNYFVLQRLADKIEKRLIQELSDRGICEMDGYMDGYDKGYQDGKEDYDCPKT